MTTACDKFDDPTPTTVVWLLACGGKKDTAGIDCVNFKTDTGQLSIYIDGDAYHGSEGEGYRLPGQYATCGKVRKLFDAFQIPLNEPEETQSVGPLWAVKRPDGLFIGQQGGVPQDSFVAYPNRKQAAEKASCSSGKVIRIA